MGKFFLFVMFTWNSFGFTIDTSCDLKQSKAVRDSLELLKTAAPRIFEYFESQTKTIQCAKSKYQKEPGADASHDVKSFVTIVYPSFWNLDLIAMASTLAHEARHNEHHFYDHVACNRSKGSSQFEGCDQSFDDYGPYRVSYEVYKAIAALSVMSRAERSSAEIKAQIVLTTHFNDQGDNKGRGIYSFWALQGERFFSLSLTKENKFKKGEMFSEVKLPKNARIFPVDLKGNENSEILVVISNKLILYSPVVSQSFEKEFELELPGHLVAVLEKQLVIQEPDSLNLYWFDYQERKIELAQVGVDQGELNVPASLSLNQTYMVTREKNKFYYLDPEKSGERKMFHEAWWSSFQVQNLNWDDYDDVVVFEPKQLIIFFGNHTGLEKGFGLETKSFDQVVLLKHFEPVEGIHFKKD